MSSQRELHVWMYWESRPGQRRTPYLDLCFETIRLHLDPTMSVHLLDERSIFEWLPDLKDHVWRALATPVRRSDFARVRLVHRYGGLWLDADCIVLTPLSEIVDLLATEEVVGWGRDLEGRFYNGLFAARPEASFLERWIEVQDQVLHTSDAWDRLSWAALGQDITRKLAATHQYHDIPSSRIAPVPWYEWRRLLSPLQSPARVLESDPLTVMLWNSAMGPYLAARSANQLLKSRVLLGRLFRIALGLSDVREELDIATWLSFCSDLRFGTNGRRVEGRLRSLGGLRS
jgi:hypothetical protein